MKSKSLWAVDTNVLVYATAPDAPADKQNQARHLLGELFASPHGCLPGQVLSEYLAVVLRKKTMSTALATETVAVWAQTAKVLGASAQTYEQAWLLAGSHQYQVWDALIVAVCAEHGVKKLFSEDVGSMPKPLGVQVINPFLETGTANSSL